MLELHLQPLIDARQATVDCLRRPALPVAYGSTYLANRHFCDIAYAWVGYSLDVVRLISDVRYQARKETGRPGNEAILCASVLAEGKVWFR